MEKRETDRESVSEREREREKVKEGPLCGDKMVFSIRAK